MVKPRNGSTDTVTKENLNCFAMMDYTNGKVPLLMRKTTISDNVVLFQFPEYLFDANPDILTHYTGWSLTIPDTLSFVKAYQTRPFFNDYNIQNGNFQPIENAS